MKSPKSIPNPTGHPARYSGAIIDRLPALIRKHAPDVSDLFDCYAGTGERLQELADLLPEYVVRGIELEGPFIVNQRLVKQGNARNPRKYPKRPFAIVTSPVYPNGMADEYEVKDVSRRATYNVALHNLTGEKLHPDNMGRYGYRGTKRGGTSVKRAAYWELAEATVAVWTGNANCRAVFVNVSDFPTSHGMEPLVDDWKELLRRHGWRIKASVKVVTPRDRSHENSELRAEHEVIIVAVKPT